MNILNRVGRLRCVRHLQPATLGGWLWTPGRPSENLDSGLGRKHSQRDVETIFPVTFVLITQNRMSDVVEPRTHLGLQVGLLNEHETTRILRLVVAMSEQTGIMEAKTWQAELEASVRPVAVRATDRNCVRGHRTDGRVASSPAGDSRRLLRADEYSDNSPLD